MEYAPAAPPQLTPHLPLTPTLLRQLEQWLAEDLGRGDLSAAALVGRSGRASAGRR